MKDAWTSEEPEDMRRVHVPYDSEGHVSLAYIFSHFKDEALEFVKRHLSVVSKRTLALDHVTYQDEWGRETAISLEGSDTSDGATEAAPRASKGARRSEPLS